MIFERKFRPGTCRVFEISKDARLILINKKFQNGQRLIQIFFINKKFQNGQRLIQKFFINKKIKNG